jgi:TetR/AcrR family transcriptional regulator, transcriptional repressor for nem operon
MARLQQNARDIRAHAPCPHRIVIGLILDRSFQFSVIAAMARRKEFDEDSALDAAMETFRDWGFAATSADMLVQALGIGRQSLYDTFGDKWQLYLAALRRYVSQETQAHLAALKSGPRAIDGLQAMIDRVVESAATACLGVGSICEFGSSQPDVTHINEAAGHPLHAAIAKQIRSAQSEGDIATDIDAKDAAGFLIASIAGIRVMARGGAARGRLRSLGNLALRALK